LTLPECGERLVMVRLNLMRYPSLTGSGYIPRSITLKSSGRIFGGGGGGASGLVEKTISAAHP
jgi:hypothetical protein